MDSKMLAVAVVAALVLVGGYFMFSGGDAADVANEGQDNNTANVVDVNDDDDAEGEDMSGDDDDMTDGEGDDASSDDEEDAE